MMKPPVEVNSWAFYFPSHQAVRDAAAAVPHVRTTVTAWNMMPLLVVFADEPFSVPDDEHADDALFARIPLEVVAVVERYGGTNDRTAGLDLDSIGGGAPYRPAPDDASHVCEDPGCGSYLDGCPDELAREMGWVREEVDGIGGWFCPHPRCPSNDSTSN